MIQKMEALKPYPILLLGAGSGLGQEMALKFASEGYQVITGTRSQQKFDALRRSVDEAGGVEPKPFIADITDTNSLLHAYNGSSLVDGEKVHFFPVAAGGMEKIGRSFMEALVTLQREARTGSVSVEKAEELTEKMKTLTTAPEAMAAAMAINRDAPLVVFDLLDNDGHLDKDSVVLNTSSSISDGFEEEEDLENPQNYKGPWFYYTIAASKKAGVLALRQRAEQIGALYVDIAAPEIVGTSVGGLIDKLVNAVQQVEGVGEISVPKILRPELAGAIFAELTNPLAAGLRAKTVYVESGKISYVRPEAWDKPLVPYF